MNETCGGSYGKFGVCQKSLDCIAMDDSVEEAQFVGICKGKSYFIAEKIREGSIVNNV